MTAKQLNKYIGETIRRMRKLKEITLPDLAKRSKVSKGCISRIENGKGNPTVETLVRLGNALKCDPWFFLKEY